MRKSSPEPLAWSGRAAIDVGMGVFEGQAGDNCEHCHWAHQLSMGLPGPVEVISKGETYQASTLFIAAGTPHQLAPSAVRSVYLDPTSAASQALCSRLNATAGIVAVPPDLAELCHHRFNTAASLAEGLAQLRQALQGSFRPDVPDPLLQMVLAKLQLGIQTATIPDRRSLAQMAGLSESRFSHWFCENTGMPLRSYRKWLRLIHGLQQVLEGQTLTEAAHLAQFSDQAHFTRTFVQMFGIRPSDLLMPHGEIAT